MTSYTIALTMIGRTDQASQAAEDEFAWAKTWGAPRFIGMALRAELRAAGAKPRRDAVTGRNALTASETRIAEMAATGKTNAQIAQALFLTPGTIEKHLTTVYAKLHITTRRELPAALRNEPASAPGR